MDNEYLIRNKMSCQFLLTAQSEVDSVGGLKGLFEPPLN